MLLLAMLIHRRINIPYLGVVCVQHSVGNVRNVVTGIRLSSDKYSAILQIEGIDEVLPESQKLSGYICFAGCGRNTLGESSANWLFYPHHIG